MGQHFALEGSTGKGTRISSFVTSVQVANINTQELFNIQKIFIMDQHQLNLPQLMDHPGKIAQQYDHLRQFNIPILEDLEVSILIGQDNIHLITPTKFSRGPNNTPCASFFNLGWTISGPHNDPSTENSQSVNHYSVNHITCQQSEDEQLGKVKEPSKAEVTKKETTKTATNKPKKETTKNEEPKNDTNKVERRKKEEAKPRKTEKDTTKADEPKKEENKISEPKDELQIVGKPKNRPKTDESKK